MKMNLYRGIIMLAAGAMLLIGLAGCGSSGAGPTFATRAASARLTIQWPSTPASTGRLVPATTQSIKLVLSDTSGFSTFQVVDRPATGTSSTVTFTNLPVGGLTVTATAYPQTGAAGIPLATGSSPLTILAGQQASITLTMASTIDHLDITATGLTTTVSGTLQLTATPKDVSGNVVLVAAGNITWSSGTPGVATVDSTGKVTGVSAGTAVITAKESDSQKSASATVTVTGSSGPALTLSLDASQNDAGTVKVTSITKAELLSTAGAVVATATITAGTAQFSLSGLTVGSYFIRVNSLADDLVPTKIDSTAANITQFVGTSLSNSVIGTLASPTYQIKTFSKGQAKHAVVKYSNGAAATPERYAYVLLSLTSSAKLVEVRVLGTGALLTNESPSHHPFPGWILGSSDHGTQNTGGCGCHGTLTSHPASYSSINQSSGWCFKCHYGQNGSSSGFVDTSQ